MNDAVRMIWQLSLAIILAYGGAAVYADTTQHNMTARDILAEADKARGNLAGAQWTLQLHAKDAKGDQEMTLKVLARGFDVMAEILAPPRSKGDRLVIFKENMWYDKPSVSKPVPISKRQKLLGQAAYGDIATTDYAGDYDPTLIEEEKVNGRLCWVYNLEARSKGTTYDRIKYWIDKKELIGIKAEYYTVSGKLFKSALMEYDHSIERGGEKRPFISRITISGGVVSSERTTLTFSSPSLEVIPDHTFNLRFTR